MNQLLEKNQELSIVPQDFKNSNKGKVVEIQDMNFSMEVAHTPEGIAPKKVMEFYSQTKHGMLYFVSDVLEVSDKTIKVSMPIKHRFLQRRAFTRINYSQNMQLSLGDKNYEITSADLSAGGMKFKINESLDIDAEYTLSLKLLGKCLVQCKFDIIKIQKEENSSYTVSGRFKNLESTDKMKIIQFCMSKNIENVNR